MGTKLATMRGIKIPTFVQKPRQLAGETGGACLLIDVPIVLAQEKIQFPLRRRERERGNYGAQFPPSRSGLTGLMRTHTQKNSLAEQSTAGTAPVRSLYGVWMSGRRNNAAFTRDS